jgi:N-dimethylarginine dimethylaminohydrolase
MKIEFNRKTVYFADTPFDGTVESEYFDYIKPQHEKYNLFIDKNNIKFTEKPPFVKLSNPVYYDLLIFNWKGILGNAMLEHFCEIILEESEEYPNKLYVIASKFTIVSYLIAEAMEDMIRELDNRSYFNVFLNFKDLADFLKKHKQFT